MTITPYQIRKLNAMSQTDRLIKCHQLGIKRCSTCRKYLDRDLFYRNKASRDGINGNCKECSRNASKAWLEANADYVESRDQANLEIARAAAIEILKRNMTHKAMMGPDRAEIQRLRRNKRMREQRACPSGNQ